MEALESVLADAPFLERLRPDEVARVAARFERVIVAPGGRFALGGSPRRRASSSS